MSTSVLGTNEDSTDYVKLVVKIGEVLEKHTQETSSGQISAMKMVLIELK